ncbi:hypothetical protein H4Q26_003654 [Puccinia striiformis f. sp. tritici PST-130]|nr:hypothetical protein H4Q26_003654 [Puccinia striiformis f. sp. tritici PST-130]
MKLLLVVSSSTVTWTTNNQQPRSQQQASSAKKMSSPFIGLPISAELSSGTIVEGTIQDINLRTGKLKLRQAPPDENSASSPSDFDSLPSPTHNYNPHQQKKNQQQNVAINQLNPDQSSSHNGSEVTIKQQQQPPP